MMPDSLRSAEAVAAKERGADLEAHPRGTLAIVLIFGALFALGWLAVYLFVFLQRGAPHL